MLKSRSLSFGVGALLVSALGVHSASAADAVTVVVNFDTLASDTLVSAPNVFPDLQFSGAGNAPLYAFDLADFTDEVFPGISGIFVSGDLEAPGFPGLDGPFRADFSIEGVRGVSVAIGDDGEDEDALYLRAYDLDGNLLAEDNAILAADAVGALTLSITSPDTDIAYVLFGGIGMLNLNNTIFDNFHYVVVDTTTEPNPNPNPNPVPTPSAAVAGLGLMLGLGLRRSRRN